MKSILKKLPVFRSVAKKLNNVNERTDWVKSRLQEIPRNSLILDAGCGSQRFRKYCSHLNYRGQDFGKYTVDQKKMISDQLAPDGNETYQYGDLDYIGDVWQIDEADGTFDAILCTEVFEHIPYPIETLAEFSRLLKPGGTLLLTAPSNCLRHMDPYFFYTGFSDRWYEKFLEANGLEPAEIQPVGDYYSWIAVELARTAATHNIFSKLLLAPAFLYYFSKRKTQGSIDSLCMGYHVKAIKA